MWKPVFAIALSAAGALLGWLLGLKLNARFPSIPPATLATNPPGGYVTGLAIAFSAAHALSAAVLFPLWARYGVPPLSSTEE